MNTTQELELDIARLEEAARRADESARAAREALADLDRKRREIKRLLATDMPAYVEAVVNDAVATGLEQLEEEFRSASDLVERRMVGQVDKLLNLAFGRPGNRQGRSRDLRPQLAEKIRFWILEQVREVEYR